MARRIESLLAEDKKVYLWMVDKQTAIGFLQAAEHEGFMYEDGKKPTEKDIADIFRIFGDKKLCYVGAIGHMAFQANKDDTVRVDYRKFAEGNSDYIYQK